ncbi:hypothetical protein GZH49_37735 [Nocardia terpenica]|uniref:hypothetical protein n=1 Tax=Nocardia terpenica TaxID=455432 RepID=UPI002FE043D0
MKFGTREMCSASVVAAVVLAPLIVTTPAATAASGGSCKKGQAFVSGNDYIPKYAGRIANYQGGRKGWRFDEDAFGGRWAPGTCLTPSGSVSGDFNGRQCSDSQFDKCWVEINYNSDERTVKKYFYKAAGEKYYFDGDDITWVRR